MVFDMFGYYLLIAPATLCLGKLLEHATGGRSVFRRISSELAHGRRRLTGVMLAAYGYGIERRSGILRRRQALARVGARDHA
jgi:hypothetical protein